MIVLNEENERERERERENEREGEVMPISEVYI